ncbi:MAG: urease accessory protein UreF [Mesorhizobium sp.]|nr:urease accessory protein UreF [Mesorhizobium sp.]
MADGAGSASLLKLLAWLSPTFPVGSFSYSHGLETAAHEGLVADAASLRTWLADLIGHGSAWNDCVLFAEAHRLVAAGGELSDLADLADLGEAMAGSRERHMETMLQGGAFLKAAAAWPHPALGQLPAECPYPVAVGAVAGAHGVPLESALAAFLQGFASNQIQAAIRLGVLGQTNAMATLSALEPLIGETARRAAVSTLDDLGSCTVMAEIAAMKHESHYSRLFRT